MRRLDFKPWRERLTRAVIWDGFMVYLAFLNVGLIAFDLTYLWLRPLYFEYTPPVTRLYDRVKGIEPHPLTTTYLDAVDALEAELAASATGPEALDPHFEKLRSLSLQILDKNPFERSGQSRNLVRLTTHTRRWIAERGELPLAELSAAEAFERLWSPGTFPVAAVEFFQSELRPILEVNYHREYELDGALTDYFWLLDLPFLLIFAVEFSVRWVLAIRRRTYPKWFLFPIINWYDVLGLVPVRELRFFRLFRVASIYVRLYKSDRSGVGDDIVSRTVKYFANIINEEISDMVSLRILNETQEEIRSGTHRRIIRAIAEPRRDVVARELTLRLRDAFASTDTRQRTRAFLEANLKRSAESAAVLRRVPLPNAVVRPLVEVVGTVVFDAIVETMAATLDSEEGQETLQGLVAAAIDGLVDELTEGEVEALVREIAIDAVEHVKEAVKVRKWVDAETPIQLDDSASASNPG